MRGMGRIYKRGGTYWLQYSHRGQVYRESSHSDRETVARKLLKKRLGEIGIQKFIGPTEERITFEDLAAALLTDYEINAKRSIDAARRAPVVPDFASMIIDDGSIRSRLMSGNSASSAPVGKHPGVATRRASRSSWR